MNFNLENILRKNIKKLVPYSSARNEYTGNAAIFLDANENNSGSPLIENYNRYPDPLQIDVKEKLSKIKNVQIENVFLGNGSDEAIDILFRAFCNPGQDNVIVCPPTYGMYEVSAAINDVSVLKTPLTDETFQLDTEAIIKAITKNTRLIFICYPNNPTGNAVKWESIKTIITGFSGIVIVDEAYIDFTRCRSLIAELENYPNLVILQTLSKAWGLAGLRVGLAFASKQIIDVFNKIKSPYNINIVSQKLVIEALDNAEQVSALVKQIILERTKLADELAQLPFVLKVYPSEANFILAKTTNANSIYNYLIENKIVVRNRSRILLCEECLRISIGTVAENKELLNVLKKYNS